MDAWHCLLTRAALTIETKVLKATLLWKRLTQEINGERGSYLWAPSKSNFCFCVRINQKKQKCLILADLTGPNCLTLVFPFSFPGKKHSKSRFLQDRERSQSYFGERWKTGKNAHKTLTTSKHLNECLPNDDSGKLWKKSRAPNRSGTDDFSTLTRSDALPPRY